MKKACKLFTVIMAIAGFGTSASAQTVNTVIGAKVVAAITLAEVSPMHFGTMTSPTTISQVNLLDDGSRTTTGDVTLLAQLPNPAAASYEVTGEGGATYAITLPATATISNGIPANNMTVSNFVCSIPSLVGTISFSGTDEFTLGAKLTLAAGQASGSYAGTFDVSVAYN